MIAWFGSFVLVGEAAKDGPGYKVADDVNTEQGPHAGVKLRVLCKLRVWVALSSTPTLPSALVHRQQTSLSLSHLSLEGIEIVLHKSLVSVLEDREVLESFEVDWDLVRADEETSEEHEWDNQHWSQSHRQLLV